MCRSCRGCSAGGAAGCCCCKSLLIAVIVFVGVSDPAVSPFIVALGVLGIATASATQDIIVDAFRVESLDESEQAAGMAAYVAGYRVGALVSTAGALFLVSYFQTLGFDHHAAWRAGYFAMAVAGADRHRDDARGRRAAAIGQGGSDARARERAAPSL